VADILREFLSKSRVLREAGVPPPKSAIQKWFNEDEIDINEAIDLLKKHYGLLPHEAMTFLNFDDSQGGMRSWEQ
jgi:hypothetical protein